MEVDININPMIISETRAPRLCSQTKLSIRQSQDLNPGLLSSAVWPSLGKPGLSYRTLRLSLSYQLAALCHLCNHRLEEVWGPSFSSCSLIYSGWYVALGLEKAGVVPPVVGVGPGASPSTCLRHYIRALAPRLFLSP